MPPLADHSLVQSLAFVLPALILPLVLGVLVIRDRIRRSKT